MRLVNFTFDSSTEIGIDGRRRYLDLHNIYAWEGVSYFTQQRKARMSWSLPPVGSFGLQAKDVQNLPGVLVLEFRGVSKFAASPQDSEMPYSEGVCLNAVTFAAQAEHRKSTGAYKVFRDDVGQMTFKFQSGFCLTMRRALLKS